MRRAAQLILLLAASLPPSTGHAPTPRIRALAPVELVAAGFEKPVGVVVDGAGGMIFVSDRREGTVTRVAPDGAERLLLRRLKKPVGLALDGEERLLIVEEGRGRLLRREPSGRLTVLAFGMKHPRWIAIAPEDGGVYLTAHGLRADHRDDEEDEGDQEHRHGEMILRLADGALRVFADGFKGLEGVAVRGSAVYAVTERLLGEREREGTTLVRIPIEPDGDAGRLEVLVRGNVRDPVGLALDRLGAVFFTAARRREEDHRDERGLILKWLPDGRLVTFATGLKDPRGLAFDAAGHLLAAERGDHHGRLLRFRAPLAPVFHVPAFTTQSLFLVSGTTEPGARVDLFVNDAATAAMGISDAAGAFSLPVPLMPNASNSFEGSATLHAGDGLTSPPAEATLTHDDRAPGVSFQDPPANSFVRGTVTVQAQATDDGSQVASLALRVGTQPLTATLSPAPAPSVSATAAWNTIPVGDGLHMLTAMARDQAGNLAMTTRVVTVDGTPPDTQISGGPEGTIAETSVTFTVTGTDNLTPERNLHFAWRLDGGAWSEFTATTTATFTNLAPGLHTFEAKARDLAGNEDPTPARQSFTVAAGVLVRITSPADGAPVPAALLLVTGTVEANGAEVAIIVNGVPAALEGTAFAAQVGVTRETSTLTAVATTAGGARAMHTIAVTVTGEAATAGALLVTPQSGLGPLTVRFSLAGVSPRTVALDLDGDGTVDFTGVSLDDQSFIYTQPGLYFPIAIVTDAAGAQRVFRTVVQVYDRSAIDGVLRAKWNGMKSALARGDSEGALGFFTDTEQGRYRAIFTALSPHLAGIAQEIGDIELIYVVEGRAKYRLRRTQLWGGQLMTLTYYVYFVQDGSAFWRIEGF